MDEGFEEKLMIEPTKNYSQIIISSADRTRGISESFEIDFTKPIKHIKSISFEDVVIPTSYYLFSHSGTIGPDLGGDEITISDGTYTPQTLAIELESQMDDAKMSNASVVWNTSTRKFTISSDDTFSLEENYQLAHFMGFTTDKTSVTTATSDDAVTWESRFFQNNRLKFSLTEGATTNEIVINEGNYSTSELATELTSKINASSFSGFSMTYNINKHIYELTKLSSFSVTPDTTNYTDLAFYMGYNSTVSASGGLASATSTISEIINYDELGVTSRTLAEQQQAFYRYADDFSSDQIANIFPTESPGDVVRFRPDERTSMYFGNINGITLSTLDINLLAITNRSGNSANYESIYLNGLEWQFKMILNII
jgi:hypothetical protein